MKNLSIVLNAILLVAVVVLYVLYFSDRKPATSASRTNDTSNYNLKIAYINSDTILKYYDYLKAQREQLEAKTKKMDSDLQKRAEGLQNEFAAYQRNVNSMTLGQVRAAEEDLTKKRNNLQMYEQTLAQQVMVEQEKINKELYDRVTSFLKTYGQDRGLQVVFKYNPNSDMLYGGETLDITREVVDGLNDAYKNEKSGTASKADSTATN
jgi:outer membrane protein